MFNIVKAVYLKNRWISKNAYPYTLMMQRVISGIMLSIFPVFTYIFVFDQNLSNDFIQSTNSESYINFIIIGQIAYILIFSTLMNVGRCLILEIREGTINTFLLSPASRIGYFIGTYIEQFGRSCIEILIILMVGIILGFRIDFVEIPLFLLILILISISSFCVSILLSSIMVFTRDTFLTQNTLIIIIGIICGISFPVSFLPDVIQYITNFFPLTKAIELFRNILINKSSLEQNYSIIFMTIILSLLYAIIGYFWYRRIEKKMIENALS